MKQLLFLPTLLLALPVFSQTQVVFKDDFSDNHNEWASKSDDVLSSEVSGGHFMVNMKKDEWWWMNCQWATIDSRKPFKITTEFMFTSASSLAQLGLMWEYDDSENNKIFTVKKTGSYALKKNTGGKETDLIKWTKCGKAFELNKYYRLTVYSDGSKYHFYLDTTHLAEYALSSFGAEKGVGFYFNSKSNIRINSLEVLQDRGTVNVVEGDFSDRKKQNLGANVNTINTEKHPVISHDGKTLYFIRTGDERNVGSDKMKEDIWYSHLNEAGDWGEAKNLGEPVNNSANNGLIAAAPDNSYIIVKHVYDEKGNFLKSGFSVSHREGNGWSRPKEIVVQDYYNDADYVESSMSPDGNVLIFAIKRKDTNGEKDIYFSKRNGDGTFSAPVNCGGVVNSFADEIGPFMAADGITMYYASEGLPGYGGADIFMTRRLDDTWTNWSQPVNLGPAINTPGWDAYFSTDSKGKYAYMVSDENSIGKLDVFRIELPEKAKPVPQALIHGVVYNSKTSQPMLAEITFHVIETDSTLGSIYSGPVSGDFSMIIPGGYHYSIMANYPGYIGERINVDVVEIEGHVEKEVMLWLKPIEKEEKIALNNVFFEENSAELHYKSKAELHQVYNLLKQYPKMKLEIGGHAMKADGDPKLFIKLSEQRAKAVYRYLVDMGISKKRLTYKGYGYSEPVSSTGTAAENAQNRCVQFVILEM